ncbi:loganic acid O-methyltransferase-like isoform X3 [Malus domestica]|uniref:loganic acid O-methyltransferase-like isoform X3 n=1 Tax=Malus domestica TaxID=3750 RepID=UPI0039753A48
MTEVEDTNLSAAYPMNAGDGRNSYAKNSTFQKSVVNSSKEILRQEIEEKLDVHAFLLSSCNTFRIADLGCSTGPNTFFAVETILETVQLKYQSQGLSSHQIPKFQVFFNDQTTNDFNMLFKSLPQNRQYYAAGVPGSFYGRIFPNASIHFFHCSSSNHWLSRVPKEIVNKESPAWNKGKIYYSSSTTEVTRAYETQHALDMECFLNARAQEIVYGGLMVLIISCRPNGTPHSHTLASVIYETLGSCLVDMARKGLVNEEKIDSFNIPVYVMSPQELEVAVERTGYFSIERKEILPNMFPNSNLSNALLSTSHVRAVHEEHIKQHFGEEIIDEVFNLYHKKVEEQPSKFELGKTVVSIAVLKRNAN